MKFTIYNPCFFASKGPSQPVWILVPDGFSSIASRGERGPLAPFITSTLLMFQVWSSCVLPSPLYPHSAVSSCWNRSTWATVPWPAPRPTTLTSSPLPGSLTSVWWRPLSPTEQWPCSSLPPETTWTRFTDRMERSVFYSNDIFCWLTSSATIFFAIKNYGAQKNIGKRKFVFLIDNLLD